MQTIYGLAKKDDRVTFVGSDLTRDSLFEEFSTTLPNQFFMEGVTEAHAAGMSAGLASCGKIVYFNTIATFITRRCFEQTVVDIALANANVRLIANGGGLVYAPLGPTHLATEDIAIMRPIPNMTIICPSDADEMERAILASHTHQGPIYVRMGKGGDPIVSKSESGFEIGKAIFYPAQNSESKRLVITTGIMLSHALSEKHAVLHMHTVKPLDLEALKTHLPKYSEIETLEEHSLVGGLGSAVAEWLSENLSLFSSMPKFKRRALPDHFPDTYGSQASLLKMYGLIT